MLRAIVVISMLAIAGAACSKDPDVLKRQFVESGDAYVADGKPHEAIIQYRNALQQDPLFGEARAKLAESYLAIDDRANAAAEFVRAADALPDDLALQLRAGNILLVHREFEAAIERADRVLAADRGNVDALVLRANGLAGLNQLEDALADIDAAIEADPDRINSYATLGTVQLVRGDQTEAETAFKRAIEIAPSSVPAHLALANYYLATRNYSAAETALKATLEAAPGNLVAHRALAYYYIGNGRAADAESHLRVVAEASPDPGGRIMLADYYLFTNREAESRTLFEQIAAGTGRHATIAKLRLATLAASSNNRSDASRWVDEALEADPSNSDAMLAKAELQVAEGDLDAALASARGVVTGGQNSAKAQFAIGHIHRLRQEVSDAETAFSNAVQMDPRHIRAHIELATLRLAAGRLADAEPLAQRALDLSPSLPDAQLLVARVALARGNVARAEPILRNLERTSPRSPQVATAVGVLELAKRQPGRARAALERARTLDAHAIEPLQLLTQLDLRERKADAARTRLAAVLDSAPDNVDVMLLASTTAAASGDLAEAERLAKAALERDPNSLRAYGVLGRVYLGTHRLAEATAEFSKVAERQPNSVAAHTAVGILLQMQDRTDEAKAVFERVMQIDSNAAVAANNLAWIYAEHGGNVDVALQLARTAKARLPNQPEVNDTLGWILHKRGLSAQAIGPLQEAISADPTNASYHHHLGLALAATGDRAKARSSLERALALDKNYTGAAEIHTTLSTLDTAP